MVHNPSEMPVPGTYDEVQEPYELATVVTPSDYIGPVLELCEQRRGTLVDMRYLTPAAGGDPLPLAARRDHLRLLRPAEVEDARVRVARLRPLGIRAGRPGAGRHHAARRPVDAFSAVVHKDKAYQYGRALTTRLRELIPRQLFEVAIQATIGSRVIARETVRAKRKDVLAKCYGGDITRKRKLLEKQKEGKRRMRRVGRVDVPQEAFIAALAWTRARRGREAMSAGLYVHIPFCLTRCGYCDFNTYAGWTPARARYWRARRPKPHGGGRMADDCPFVSVSSPGEPRTMLSSEILGEDLRSFEGAL
jgi:GTP-binding protein LepA